MKTVIDLMKLVDEGEHLTDAEMVRLRDFYHEVTVAVTPFGAKYELVFMDAIRQEARLNDYLRSRGVKTPAKEKLVYDAV